MLLMLIMAPSIKVYNGEYFIDPLFKEEAKMKIYNKQIEYYCGIDLHAKTMYICIQDKNGKVVVHRNILY